ncbi:MAG: transketolase [Burkholderiales bacterium 21-58-4]|nr:MAG: transketolase [Burkholderiales bacterium 21-58-4]
MTVKLLAMRDALLTRIWEAMGSDERIFFLSADFGSPILDRIRADFPSRFVNVGIAEQNLINVSAGLSLEGQIVFAYAIAPFITMRCFEQLRVNLALLSQVRAINVNLIGVGAGYSYVVSGPTHQCYEDLTLVAQPGPKYLRFDAQLLPVLYDAPPDAALGFHVHRRGGRVCLVATGYMLHTALHVAETLAAEGQEVSVADLFDITGFDEDSLAALLAAHDGLVTMEEGFRGRGGIDALFFEFVSRRGLALRHLNIGVAPGYSFELGTRSELHEKAGIGVQVAGATIRNFISSLG